MKNFIPFGIFMLLLTAALFGCKDEDGRNVVRHSYVIDPQTELCFADGFEAIAHVPCNEAVIALADGNEARFTYYIDPQTNLCFADAYEAMAGVPCTDKVKQLISE